MNLADPAAVSIATPGGVSSPVNTPPPYSPSTQTLSSGSQQRVSMDQQGPASTSGQTDSQDTSTSQGKGYKIDNSDERRRGWGEAGWKRKFLK